jgi:hypothetical protein
VLTLSCKGYECKPLIYGDGNNFAIACKQEVADGWMREGEEKKAAEEVRPAPRRWPLSVTSDHMMAFIMTPSHIATFSVILNHMSEAPPYQS